MTTNGFDKRPEDAKLHAGRKKGSRNKLDNSFIDVLYNDFLENGQKAIETARAEDPMGYMRCVASILPKKLEIEKRSTHALSDEQLEESLATLTSIAQSDPSIISGATGGEGETGAGESAKALPTIQ